MFHGIGDHLVDGFPHVFSVQNPASLFVNDLTLLVVNLVIFQQVLTDSVVVALDLLLCFLDGTGEHFVLNLFIFRNAQGFEHGHQLLGTEQTHQIIFQGNVKAGFTRVSLTSGTAS